MQIEPASVRYIKLGAGGGWLKECLTGSTLRFGFFTGREARFQICARHDWPGLMQNLLADGRSRGAATNIVNQTKAFFEDDGSMLWITFEGPQLYWAMLTEDGVERHESGEDVFRRVRGAWSGDSADGKRLTTARLTGGLAALAHFRGTSCSVESGKAEHVVRRINGTTTPEIDRARAALTAMHKAASELIRRLQPEDFELLVDLIFSRSGWRRESTRGGSQELIDIELMLPTTSERAFVQVKSETTPAEFRDYSAGLARHNQFARMFTCFTLGRLGSPMIRE
jgi:hypothetical protein